MKILTYEKHLPDSAKFVRKTVFEDEQGFVDEFDETDEIATHFVMQNENDEPIATCRVFPDTKRATYILGRFAVVKDYRNKNLGSAIMHEAEQYVIKIGGKSITLHAQYQAAGFYEKQGFKTFGDMDDEQGYPHVWMRKVLDEKY